MILPKGSKIIKIDMFNAEILVLTGKRQINSFCKSNNITLSDIYENGEDGCCVDIDKPGCRGILIVSIEWSLSVLVHELIHAAHYLMERKGVPISESNSEVEAYMVQCMLRQALKLLGKKIYFD